MPRLSTQGSMPRHMHDSEKSPVDDKDYEGLQLDTRARAPDKHLDDSKPQGMLDDDFDNQMNYINEKQLSPQTQHGPRLMSPDPSTGTGTYGADCGTFGSSTLMSPGSPDIKRPFDTDTASHEGSQKEDRERRICGLRRRHFWGFAGLTLGLLIAAAVVGGVVGGLRARNKNDASSPSTAASTSNATKPSFPEAQWADVIIGSPINLVSYDQGGNTSPSKRQVFRLVYQSILGNVKEAVLNGSSTWQNAKPLFTDALNNTGLSTVAYRNGSEQQGSIFYVGNNGLLQEKRRLYDAPSKIYWQPGTLNDLTIPMNGYLRNRSPSATPQSGWDGYRMAAVYSTKFSTGAGSRLFYHAAQSDGTSVIQELIWTQENDTWTTGANISTASPLSALSATIDETLSLLRLFYSTGNGTLQESTTSLHSAPGTPYKKGLTLPNYLAADNADLATVSINGTTLLYHYATAAQTAAPGIHELSISGVPGSANNQESFNLSEPLVASADYPTGTNASMYQPLSAARSSVGDDDGGDVLVFWADEPVGEVESKAIGYGKLKGLRRGLRERWPADPADEVMEVGLGYGDNSQPS